MAFTIKSNDTRPLFVVALKDDYGESTEAAVDLTTASTAVFNMRQAAGTMVKLSRAPGTVTDGTAGEVTYYWGASGSADTDTTGDWYMECEIGWNDGRIETFPNNDYWEITIVEDLG